MVVARYVIEGTIRGGIRQAQYRPPEGDAYEMIKRDIGRALWVAERFYRSHVPDLRIEFVDSYKEVPKTVFPKRYLIICEGHVHLEPTADRALRLLNNLMRDGIKGWTITSPDGDQIHYDQLLEASIEEKRAELD
jgi:hypothetical protein